MKTAEHLTEEMAISPKRNVGELSGVRKKVLERCKDTGVTLADLSRGIGRNNAYVHQFVHKGTPKRLDEEARSIIAEMLELDPDDLREQAVQMRSRNALAAGKADPVIGTTRGEIPLFRETDVIDLANASRWVQGLPTIGPSVSFAVWIERPRKKLTPGDIVFARPGHPVRTHDQVVVLAGDRVAALGEVYAVGVASITVECLMQNVEFICTEVSILKIVGVAYP